MEAGAATYTLAYVQSAPTLRRAFRRASRPCTQYAGCSEGASDQPVWADHSGNAGAAAGGSASDMCCMLPARRGSSRGGTLLRMGLGLGFELGLG